jgi:hypothetical protein
MKKWIREGLEAVGPKYKLLSIDFGSCLYRELGLYDIEISYASKNFPRDNSSGYTVWLWSKVNDEKIIKVYPSTTDLMKVKGYLKEIEVLYSTRSCLGTL